MAQYDAVDQLYDSLKNAGHMQASREEFRNRYLSSYKERRSMYNEWKKHGLVPYKTYEEMSKATLVGSPKQSIVQTPYKKTSPSYSTMLTDLAGEKKQKKEESQKNLAKAPELPYARKDATPTYDYSSGTAKKEYADKKGYDEYEQKKKDAAGAAEYDRLEANGELKPFAQMDYEREQGLQRWDNIGEYYKRTGFGLTQVPTDDVNFGFAHRTNPVVSLGKTYNPQTKKFEEAFLTSDGSTHSNKTEANYYQSQLDNAQWELEHPLEAELFHAEQEKKDILEAKRGNLQKLDGLSDAYMGGAAPISMRATAELNDAEDISYRTALNNVEARIKRIKESQHKDTGFWRGVADTFTDPSTFSWGLSDMYEAGKVNAIKRRLEQNGGDINKLSQADRMVLEQAYKKGEAESKYKVGKMYGFGGIFASSLPFAAEFFLTGGGNLMFDAAKTAVKGAVKGAAKGAVKGVEKGLLNNFKKVIAKNTGIALRDIGNSVAMANTFGLARTSADIMNRHTGKVVMDENGHYKFEGGEGWLTAAAKGEIANTLEYYTEQLGNHLKIGKWLTKGAERIGWSKLSKVFGFLGGNKVLKLMGVQDYPSEVVEEEANIILNSLLVGDNKFSDLWDKDTQADIWGGMACSIGLMQLGAGVGIGATYAKKKHDVNVADRRANARLGSEKWKSIKDNIDNADNDNIGRVVAAIATDKKMSLLERKAAADYANKVIQLRVFNMSILKDAEDEMEEAKNGNMPKDHSTDASYTNGYNAVDEAARQEVAEDINNLGGELREFLPSETVNSIAQNPASAITAIHQNEELTPEQKKKALQYANACAKYDGMIQRVRDDIGDRIAENEEQIDQRVNHEENGGDGMIHPVTLKQDNKKVYIVDGNVQMTEDGTMVDEKKSSKTIVVRDAETGKLDMLAPSAIQNVEDVVDPNTEKETTNEAIRQEMAQAAADEIDGKLPFNVGDSYPILLSDGSVHVVQVTNNAVDMMGNAVSVSIDGQEGAVWSKEQLQEYVVAYKQNERKRINEALRKMREGIRRQTEGVEQEQERQPSALERVPKDEDGNPIYEEVDPETAWDAAVEEAQGDEESVARAIEETIKEKKAAVEQLKAAPTERGITLRDKIRNEQRRSEAIKKAQAEVDHWEQILDTRKRRDAEQVQTEGPTDMENMETEQNAPQATQTAEQEQTTEEPKPIGVGAFGNIYDAFKGKAKAAIDFLRKMKTGEAIGALHHKDIGDISLVWGNAKAGLQKIVWKHPEVLEHLQEIIDGMQIVASSDNRIVLESDSHKAVVSKKLGDEKTPQWLLTAYEKKDATGGSSDIVPEPQSGKQNGTAPLQDKPSTSKDTDQNTNSQTNGQETSSTAKKENRSARTETPRGKRQPLTEEMRNAVETIAKALGVKEVVWEETAKYNGNYDTKTGVLSIAMDAENPLDEVFGHEATHRVKQANPKAYEALKNAVERLMGPTMMNAAMQKAHYLYNVHERLNLSADGLLEEVVSDVVGEILHDKDMAMKLASALSETEEGKGVLDTIRELLRDLIRGLKHLAMDKDAANVERLEDAISKEFKMTRKVAEENKISEETAEELSSHNLTMEQGVVMSPAAAERMKESGYTPPTKFSHRTLPITIETYKKNGGAIDDNVVRDLERMYERVAMNDLVGEAIRSRISTSDARTKGKRSLNSSPLREQKDIYIRVFDMDTSCPRTMAYLTIVKEVERRINRVLGLVESQQLIEKMRAYGIEIPCTYCYVENKRQALKEAYSTFFNARRGVLNAKTEQNERAAMYGHNKKGDNQSLTKAAEKVLAAWKEQKGKSGLYNPTMEQLYMHHRSARNLIMSYLDAAEKVGLVNNDMSVNAIAGKVKTHFSLNEVGANGIDTKQEMTRVNGILNDICDEWKFDSKEGRKHEEFEEANYNTGLQNYEVKALSLWREMDLYAKSSSGAKNISRYVPYTDELLELTPSDILALNAIGGLRSHGNNDFRIDYVFDYFQLFAHMAQRGLMGHTYTKNPEYIKIFGKTGQKINMSLAAYGGENGTPILMNQDEGFNWEIAKELRKAYPNAGTMFMVTNDAQLQFALDADWVDMIIPFHSSGLPQALWKDMRQWYDYQYIQNDEALNTDEMTSLLKADGISTKGLKSDEVAELYEEHFKIKKLYDNDGKRIKPHFLPYEQEIETADGIVTIPGHKNDKETYLNLCREYGMRPRFSGKQVLVNGKMADITEHPSYMKLIKETARTENGQTPVKYNFDEEDSYLPVINEESSQIIFGEKNEERIGKHMTPSEYALWSLYDFANRGGFDNITDYKKLTEESGYGDIAGDFINDVIRSKEERPMDYLSETDREMFRVTHKALYESAGLDPDTAPIPYHPDGVEPKYSLRGKIKKTSLKTKAVTETATRLSAISSDARAKIQNALDVTKNVYEKRQNRTRGFITDISRDLGLTVDGASHYGTFIDAKGQEVELRISNHNASAQTFDERGKTEGISIVISRFGNSQIKNADNSKVHLVEFFYPKWKIEKSEGKPLVDLIESLKEFVATGEFEDKSGIGVRQEINSQEDADYMQAVERGDMETAQRMVNEAAKRAGYEVSEYQGRGAWAAPSASVKREDFDNLEALRESVEEYGAETNVYGIINGVTHNIDDFYYNPARAGFSGQAASETAQVLRKLRYDKATADTKVRVYRTVPNEVKGEELMSGDWIAISPTYCKEHGNNRYGEDGFRIIEKEVPISQIWNDGNDMREFGFDDGQRDAEKNVSNNRKLLTPVTYDDQGKVIPLSERFNERKSDFRYSLRDGVTYFSGGGLVEAGLSGVVDPKAAVEYERKAAGVYRNNFGDHIVVADVRDIDPKELVKDIDGEVGYFHASPVCKNFSKAKTNGEETPIDMATAKSTATFIDEVLPRVVTIENVKGYRGSEAMKTITDALDRNGYAWDAHVYNAADFGGYTNRERLIVRAVREGELPPVPQPTGRPKGGWMDVVEDIIDTLPEKKSGVAPWMDERLKNEGIDYREIDKPLYVFGQGNPGGKVSHAFADELLPTLRTKSGDVIVMPDGRVLKATGRVLARISGLPDSYQLPEQESLAHSVIGNGVPTQLTKGVIAPLVNQVVEAQGGKKLSVRNSLTNEERAKKFSVRRVRFEAGKKLSNEEKKEVLATLRDSYRENNTPYHIEESAYGKERRVYDATEADYVVSNITGKRLRYYITLPDGRVAHPTELYPNLTDKEVNSAARKQELLDAEASETVSKAINRWSDEEVQTALGILKQVQQLPHGVRDVGLGLRNASSYNFTVGMFENSSASQAIDFIARRKFGLQYNDPLTKEITSASNQVFGMVDNLIAELEKRTNPRFSLLSGDTRQLTPSERALRDAIVSHLRKSGLEVITDSEEGQCVLDMVNSGVRLHAKLDNLAKAANTIKNWLEKGTRGKSFTIELPEATLRMIRRAMGRGFDSHEITANNVAHSYNNHGVGGKKLEQNSIPLRKEDMQLMPYIMTAPTRVERGSTDVTGRESVRFVKELSNGVIVVVEKEQKNSPDDMETITMWAELSSSNVADARSRGTSSTIDVRNVIISTEDAAKIRQDAENAIAKDEKIRKQMVFHGSGADITAFDHSHMGEGEGAQAHGWGTYVAVQERIGRKYAMGTSIMNRRRKGGSLADLVYLYVADYGLAFEDAVERVRRETEDTIKNWRENELNESYVKTTKDELKALKGLKKNDVVKSRNLYTVEIPDYNGHNYLEEEKPLPSSIDKEDIKEAILTNLASQKRDDVEMEMLEHDISDSLDEAETGGDLYKAIALYVGDKAASDLLHEAGFVGIHYFGQQDGECYVIFNEKDAKIVDHVRFFRTEDGKAYGYTVGGKIYLDPRIASSETPIHEYGHLWITMLQHEDPKAWKEIVKGMKATPVWEEVKRLYPELETDEEIADEAFAHFSGARGAERLRQLQSEIAKGEGSVFDKAAKISALQRFKDLLKRFWNYVAGKIRDGKYRASRMNEFADKMMSDLAKGINPTEVATDGRVRALIGEGADTFRERQQRAVESKGVVAPGLNEAEVDVVNVERHHYTGDIKEATEQAINAATEKYAPNGKPIVQHYDNHGQKFDYEISGNAIAESLNPKQQGKSANKGVHLALAEHLDEVINNSIEVEEHPDYQKNDNKERDGLKWNKDALMHRFYGAVDVDGTTYRVMTLMHEKNNAIDGNGVRAYEVQTIEVLNEELSSTPNGVGSTERERSTYPVAKLLKDVEKSYDPGKKLLEESENLTNGNAAHPDKQVEYDHDRESGKEFNAETMSLEDKKPYAWEGGYISKGNYNDAVLRKNGGINTLFLWVMEHKPAAFFREVVEPKVTADNYYIGTRTNFESVYKGNTRLALDSAWNALKKKEGFVWHHSPLSESEYLVNEETGEVYRMSGHWGRVASCWWSLDNDNSYRLLEWAIGKSNIKDFKVKEAPKPEVDHYEYDAATAKEFGQRLQQTVDNYTYALEHEDMSDNARESMEEALAGYEEILSKVKSKGVDPRMRLEILNGVRYSVRRHGSEESRKRRETNKTIAEAISIVTNTPVEKVKQEMKVREQKRRDEAKEIYDAVLSGNFDAVTLQRINNYIDNATPKNPYGRRISQRLPQSVERKMLESKRENAIDALFSRISERAVSPNRRKLAQGRREIEEKKKELLKGWAIAAGKWHTDISDFTDDKEPIGRGKDSDVYTSKDGKSVIKFSKGKQNERKFPTDIDAVALYNYVFPNTAYSILGYGEINGNFVNILKQPIVSVKKGEENVSEKERVDYMETIGFHPIKEENTVFSNGQLIVADVQRGNIVRDIYGNIRVIDADVKLHTPEYGGKYRYPAVEEDTAQKFPNSSPTTPKFSLRGTNTTKYSVRDRAIVRDEYERMIASGAYQFQEAVQDSMLSLKKLMQLIVGKDTHIEDVPGYENAYLAENRMSSVNVAEQHDYTVRYMNPLLDAIYDIAGNDEQARLELVDYMMAKHGLERNIVFAERDAKEAAKKGKDYATELAKNRQKDYSGLTALTQRPSVGDAEFEARMMVTDFENAHPNTAALWDAVNEATNATLTKLYDSGLLSKDSFDNLCNMFDYYIPLQGFDQTTSDNVYGYITSKDGLLTGSPIKHAKGRISKADDPIASIGLMADNAIRQGNRNKMKQTFLTFVSNHPSDLVSASRLWLKYNDVSDEWEPVFPDLTPTDTPADVEAKVKAFEQRMEQLAKQDPKHYKRGKDANDIPYKVINNNLREHQVLVKRGGETFVLTINGNPRAAQALNGLTNPNVNVEGVVGGLLRGGEKLNRLLSAFYTTRNPDFVVSNFMRDMLYSNSMAWIKEDSRYAARFHLNFGKYNPATMRYLLGKWENGTLDDSNEMERLFRQFMMNGGETGYTIVRDIEEQKKEIIAELKRRGSTAHAAWHALGEQLDLVNRAIENTARFAAFVTSREIGRSLERSIYDAKEISVNFNKKGAGGRMADAVGQTRLGKLGSYISGLGRLGYVFWNAAIQGTTNAGRQVKRHPKKAIGAMATLYLAGVIIPAIASALGDDDDKDAYYNLPENVRRSNILINAGDQWIALPLPVEYRSFYGLGELTYSVISGKERMTDGELAYNIAGQFSQMMPLDILEGGGGLTTFIPSSVKPAAEAYVINKSWTGMPVSKDTPFNQSDPEWKKGYKSTNTLLVEGSKWLNAHSGGDDYKKGAIDINPAKLEYLINGTFSGAVNTINKLTKMAETAFGKRDFEWKNMLLANRLVKSGDERTEARALANIYYNYKEEYEATKKLLNNYKKDANYQKQYEALKKSDQYLRYEVYDNYEPMFTAISDMKKEATDAELKDLKQQETELRREMVDVLHSIDDGKKPDVEKQIDATLKREFEKGGVTKKKAAQQIAKRLGGKDSYGSAKTDYGQVYARKRDYFDLAEDVVLQTAIKRAKDTDDKGLYMALDMARRNLSEIKKGLGHGNDEAIMRTLRKVRRQTLERHGLVSPQRNK